MKTRILRLIITVGTLLTVHMTRAQEVFIEPYAEQTITGQKLGLQIGHESPLGYEIGTFIQKESAVFVSREGAEKPRFYEQEFIGVFFAGSIYSSDQFDVKVNVRTGAVNRTNFAITPAVIGSYRLSKFMKLQGGLGMRALRPTFRLGLRLVIPR